MGKIDPNGTRWEELERQLFTPEEIKDSEKRVEELMEKRQQDGQDQAEIDFWVISGGLRVILYGFSGKIEGNGNNTEKRPWAGVS